MGPPGKGAVMPLSPPGPPAGAVLGPVPGVICVEPPAPELDGVNDE